jgi:hypothetical protein
VGRPRRYARCYLLPTKTNLTETATALSIRSENPILWVQIRMTSYCTFLVLDPSHVDAVDSLCSTIGWTTRFIPDPSERFWFQKGCVTEISHPAALIKPPAGSVAGQLMVIDADETTANNVVGLVYAAINCDRGPADRTTELVWRSSPTFIDAYSTDIRRLFDVSSKSLKFLALPRGIEPLFQP